MHVFSGIPQTTIRAVSACGLDPTLGVDTTNGRVGSVAGSWPTDGSDKRYEMTNPIPKTLAALWAKCAFILTPHHESF